MRHFTFLLFLLSTSLFAQVPDLASISPDSANNWASERVYEPGDTVLHFLHDLMAKIREKGNYPAIAEAASNLATWHYAHAESEVEDSIQYYDELSLAAYRQTGDPVKISRAASQLSTTYADQYDYLKAEALLFEADSLLKPLDEPKLKADVYEKFVYLYRNSKDYPSAIEFGNRALDIYTNLPDKDSLEAMYSLFYLTGVYVMNEEPEKGLVAIERARKLVELAEDPEVSGVYLRIYGLRGYALEALGRYDEAMADYKKAYEIAKQLVPEEEMADGYKDGPGQIHYLRGEYQKAIPLLEDYIQHTQKRGAYDPTYVQKYLYLSDAYAKTQQYDKALAARDSARFVKVRELEKELAAVRGELRTRFKADEQRDIISQQGATINQQARVQLLIGALALVLLAGLIGLLYTWRNNQRKNELLQKGNQEKELLLKEIHHRVKNNLEVISSLLELQSARITEPTAKRAMQSGQSRVQSMSLLHQRLYQGNNLAGIEMKAYFQQLTSLLLNGYEVNDRVDLTLDMETVELDIDTAVPVGLIVNELVTNSLKYAFPKEEAGRISIKLTKETDKTYHLSVKDDGVGKSTDAKPASKSFGSQLVQLLVQQLDGSFKESNSAGLHTQISFTG